MDMRNGDMYPSRAAAEAAGVPSEHIAEVEAEIVRVTSGPFKGRVYRRNGNGNLLRITDEEAGK